jgi:4-amino-4-deoxy-L-arabinose transferase-like glycosyltransferase
MQTVIAWILLPCLVFTAYPLAAGLLARSPRGNEGTLWLTVCLTLALSVGILTLVMFWMSMLGVRLEFASVTLIYALATLPGWILWRRGQHRQAAENRPKTKVYMWAAGLALAGIAAAVLFNAAYWPFSRDDALGIYHAQAREIYATHALLPLTGRDSLYLTYPALMPLAYAYTYLASGWENEYLARVIPALMSLACLPAIYVFGKALDGRLAGWAGALVLALAPTLGRWASAGYVDLPMAFYYTLAALFAWRLWQTCHGTDALLTGMMMGVAAWTKNAALVGVPLLGLWLAWALVNRRVTLRLCALCLGACAALAGAWYVRNLVGAQMVIPATAWTEQAQRTAANALVFITKPDIYGLSGWVIVIGIMAALARSVRQPKQHAGDVLILLWTVPFFAVWWLLASYDPRFLLLFLPLLAVLAGIWLARMWRRVPERWQRGVILTAAALILVLAAMAMWNSVEFKDEILRRPLMDDAAKHTIVLTARNK